MASMRNRYKYPIILLAIFTAGFLRAQDKLSLPPANGFHSASHTPKYKDAVIAHRLHQNHFKRHRFTLDGLLPVKQDTMIPIVTGTYPVAAVPDHYFPTPVTPSLRGPPTA